MNSVVVITLAVAVAVLAVVTIAVLIMLLRRTGGTVGRPNDTSLEQEAGVRAELEEARRQAAEIRLQAESDAREVGA